MNILPPKYSQTKSRLKDISTESLFILEKDIFMKLTTDVKEYYSSDVVHNTILHRDLIVRLKDGSLFSLYNEQAVISIIQSKPIETEYK
jgi:hypothetical protein